MFKGLRLTLILSSLLVLLASCNAAKETVEVNDQGRFKEPPIITPDEPTNSDISLINSLVTITRERLFPGEEAIITFTARDSDGVGINEGGLNVVFSLIGDGTSTGSFTATDDSGDGVYRATLTATDFGSANTISVVVDGNTIIQLDPYELLVISGDYFREIDLSTATDQDEYQVKVNLNTSNFDYSRVQANGEDIRFFDENYVEQDFWIEKWDPSGTSEIWVKVQNSGDDKLILVYGNDSIPLASDKEGVFTYDVNKDVYYELSQAAGATNYSVSSYHNNNNVSVLTSGGYSTQSISPTAGTTYLNVINGLIGVDGPISARYLTFNDAADTVAPLTFASTVLSYPISRGNDDWDIYNPNSVAANFTLSNYDSSGNFINSNAYALAAGTSLHIDYNVSKMGLIESDLPILGLYHDSGTADAVVMMRPATDIIGPAAKNGSIGIVEDGTSGTIYFSTGATQAFSGDKGTSIDFGGGGNQELGLGIRVLANKGVVASSQADSDGTESASFWPVDELDSDYIIPAPSQFVVIACTETVNITLTDPGGNDDSGVCVPGGGSIPGKLAFGDPAVVTFQNGTRVTGDANFFMYYEYEDEDETNVTSWKQARAYSPVSVSTSIGAEQTWD